MAIEKRFNKVWNGIAWVDVYHPTSADLVHVGGNKFLDEKLTEIDGAIGSLESAQSIHVGDMGMHTTSGEKSKLANLATDAEATYAKKGELSSVSSELNGKIDDVDTQLSHRIIDLTEKTNDVDTKVDNLRDEAERVYATKDEVGGKKHVFYYKSYEDRDADDVSGEPDGTLCWVAAPKVAGEAQKATQYMLVDGVWEFLFEADANMIVSWDDIEGAPDLTPEDLEKVFELMHSHENEAVLNELDKDDEGYLTLDGKRVGEKYNRVYLDDTAPDDPNVGDLWLKGIACIACLDAGCTLCRR